jgi:hypothetical protein
VKEKKCTGNGVYSTNQPGSFSLGIFSGVGKAFSEKGVRDTPAPAVQSAEAEKLNTES